MEYAPPADVEGWEVSTPVAQGLDPDLVAEVDWRAARRESISSLLVVKDGYPVGEQYFTSGRLGWRALMQSATKSVTGALPATSGRNRPRSCSSCSTGRGASGA